jgi:RNA polymerase sigma-70 factor, ECF subfamily
MAAFLSVLGQSLPFRPVVADDDASDHRPGSTIPAGRRVYPTAAEGAGVGQDPTVEREFRGFVAERSVALQRTAYLLTGDWALAEDLVQTALLKTYLAWRQTGGIDSVEAYARKVMVNTATTWWRRRWRGERPTAQPVQGIRPDDTDQWLERDAVWQLILTLPAGQRAILVLRYYEDLTEADTARLLGVSIGTVKRQAWRAIGALRQRLGHQSTDAFSPAEEAL